MTKMKMMTREARSSRVDSRVHSRVDSLERGLGPRGWTSSSSSGVTDRRRVVASRIRAPRPTRRPSSSLDSRFAMHAGTFRRRAHSRQKYLRNGRRWERRRFDRRGILGACVLALGVLGVPAFVYDRIAMTGRYLTTTSDQELVVRREAHLSAEAFAALQKCALDHPKLRVEGSLNDSSFGKTRGFVVKFNEDGIERFRKNPDYACFVDVFDGLREPLTNAFVMNVLLCDLGDYDAYDAKEMSVDLHLDDTVGISSKHTFVAHQVSVLYVSVPEDMEGGQLELFSYGNGVVPPNAEPNDAVEPKENLMVTFRGDAFHRVRSYRTRSARERVSLVLEQYYIGDEHYAKTMAFEESCT